MAKPQKRLIEPRVYEVGVDVTQETITELTLSLTDWFVETRPNVKEPSVLARQKIRDCLEGLTADGKPWFTAANSTFAIRLKMACRFDIDKMEGIKKANEKAKAKRDKSKTREAKKKLKDREDTNIPDEVRANLRTTAKYGDVGQVFLSSAEHNRWKELKDGYQTEFPELKSVNAEVELNKLLNLLIVDERQQFALLQGGNKMPDMLDLKSITDQVVALKKALGIHPDQLERKKEKTVGGSIGEVIARLEGMGDVKAIREAFQTEEFLQLFQMYHSPSPRTDADGFQLDEIGLFAMTRCRTCACAACGTKNYVGFSIEEVEKHLVKKEIIEVTDEPEEVTVEEVLEIVEQLDEQFGGALQALADSDNAPA